mgnify:CR=1 FL=1
MLQVRKVKKESVFVFFLKANATGRNAKTVHEFLQKYYTPEEVATEKGTIKLAIRALLEVVQSGRKNLEIAVMRRGQPLQVYKLQNIFIFYCFFKDSFLHILYTTDARFRYHWRICYRD